VHKPGQAECRGQTGKRDRTAELRPSEWCADWPWWAWRRRVWAATAW